MGHTGSVAHDPSGRAQRGHLPALCAGRNPTYDEGARNATSS